MIDKNETFVKKWKQILSLTKKDRLFSERKNIIANGSKKLLLLLHEILLQKQTNCTKIISIWMFLKKN